MNLQSLNGGRPLYWKVEEGDTALDMLANHPYVVQCLCRCCGMETDLYMVGLAPGSVEMEQGSEKKQLIDDMQGT